jgi:two-component system nitrate/nitrite response regulator NarL
MKLRAEKSGMAGLQLACKESAGPAPNNPSPVLLSTHEMALMHAMTAGHTNAQLGALVNRSEKTVRNQLTRLYAKLGARNRAEAVAIFMRRVQI